MSISDKIADDADNSDDDVKGRAKEEVAVEEEGRSKRIDNDAKEQDKGQRKIYAALIFIIMTIWLIFVLVIFVLIGNGYLFYSDNVVIAFLTTTTVNVIGIFLIVARYLFPDRKSGS